MKRIALILTFSLTIFSCKKEKQLIVENDGIPLVSKVLVAGVSSYEFVFHKELKS
jgi:hypothetical protein